MRRLSELRRRRAPVYNPPSALDDRVRQFDGVLEGWLVKLQGYVSSRWPRLGRWLSD